MIKIGEVYQHILTNQDVLVLEIGKEQYKVRLFDYREIWVYDFELEEIR